MTAGKVVLWTPRSNMLAPLSRSRMIDRNVFGGFYAVGSNDMLVTDDSLKLMLLSSRLLIGRVFAPFGSELPRLCPISVFSSKFKGA